MTKMRKKRTIKVFMHDVLYMKHIGFKNKLGWFSIICLSAIPVLILYLSNPLSIDFSSFAATMTSLGKIAGISGMAMFALNLVLATRFSFLEDYFGGIDKMYKAHRIFGSTAFILLLFHPIMLAARYIPISIGYAATSLLPGSDWSVNLGIAALFLMMILIVLTIFVKMPYDKWKSTHKFLGMAFFLASLHTLFIQSDVSRFMWLRMYMASLVAVGLAAFGYRVVFGRILVKRYDYVVDSVKGLKGGITEIRMISRNNPINFTPGQFVFVSFRNGGISTEVHPFSISSSPKENDLRLSVKSLGDYTEQIKDLRKGADVKIEGPFGMFSYLNCSNKEQIWIAGGIGVTPFLSMAGSLDSDYDIVLFYCVRNEDEATYLDELTKISSGNNAFRLIPFYSEEKGRINAEIIEKLTELKEKSILLCGPSLMMNNLKKQLVKLGIPSSSIRYEEFKLV